MSKTNSLLNITGLHKHKLTTLSSVHSNTGKYTQTTVIYLTQAV